MDTPKISLMDAYMIEALRSNGVSDEELMSQLEKRDTTHWQHITPNFDFSELLPLYEKDPATFSRILASGYTVKFITKKGLQNLLKFKFDKEEGQDYEAVENGVVHLTMADEQYATLKQLLSQNWILQKQDDRISITLMAD